MNMFDKQSLIRRIKELSFPKKEYWVAAGGGRLKRILTLFLLTVMIFSLCACTKKELANMITEVHEDYVAIVWEDKTYIPYCVIPKTECGEQIGIVDDSKDDKIYEYKGYSTDEWIIDFYVGDGIAMLYREVSVTNIPDGLESEYEWNN